MQQVSKVISTFFHEKEIRRVKKKYFTNELHTKFLCERILINVTTCQNETSNKF
jgi:hypothetical protein